MPKSHQLNPAGPCPRCGNSHETVIITEFQKGLITTELTDPDGVLVKWWGWYLCPTTSEPVLRRCKLGGVYVNPVLEGLAP